MADVGIAGGHNQQSSLIGLYGWRKRCLYFVILLLVVVMLVNLGLTVWILAVLNFNINGMGNMRITDSGIQLNGPAQFDGPLYTRSISADQGSSLHLTSQRNITLAVERSSIEIGSSVNISAASFSFNGGTNQDPLLSVGNEGVVVGGDQLHVTGSQGLLLAGPLETSQVQSAANQDLELQSLSSAVHVRGQGGILIEDGPASTGVAVTSHSHITLASQAGQVILTGESIVLQGLPRTTESAEGSYEVCACSDGMLYLVPSTSSCNQDNQLCT